MRNGSAWVWGAIGILAAVAIVFAAAIMMKESSRQQSDGNATELSKEPSEVAAPLYFSTMTHMEGSFTDDKNQAIFQKHVSDIRWAMDLFDEYGAKLTIESEKPFAVANTTWEINILGEVVDRGHGVGTHLDLGYSPSGDVPTVEEVAAYGRELKGIIDTLVGSENNLGSSGGTGQFDWVLAAANAGFEFKDAVTGTAYLSMPESEREEGWTDAYIRKQGYHEGVPEDFSQAIYPLPLKDASDLEPDEDPLIVVLGGEIGELASLAEGRENCFPNCEYTEEDNAIVLDAIREADQIRDKSRMARLNIHIPVKMLNAQNEQLLRALLEAIQQEVKAGTVRWATQLGTYQGYLEWEG